MAKGNFRTDNTVCVYCGYTEVKEGKRQPMPYKIGKGANKVYLCNSCYNRQIKEE